MGIGDSESWWAGLCDPWGRQVGLRDFWGRLPIAVDSPLLPFCMVAFADRTSDIEWTCTLRQTRYVHTYYVQYNDKLEAHCYVVIWRIDLDEHIRAYVL